MRSYRYFHLDVFTDHAFGGNQLATFLDGRGLTSSQMQGMANEMAFSETTFVLPPEQPGTDVRMRIFTPGNELPMAGHPTVGSTFALARAGVIAPAVNRFVFGLGIGPVPVTLTWKGDDLTFVWMEQSQPTFGDTLSDRAGAARALGLSVAAITSTGLPVQVVSCGLPFLFVPLATRRAVDSATLDRSAYDEFFRAANVPPLSLFLFSPEPGADGATVYSRMFAPTFGISEDPATGSASGPLGCYLVRHKVVGPELAASMISMQGVGMGRPSVVHIAVGVEAGEIASVQVGGEAVLVGEGTLYVS